MSRVQSAHSLILHFFPVRKVSLNALERFSIVLHRNIYVGTNPVYPLP